MTVDPLQRSWPPGDGEMAALIREFDWTANVLGAPSEWPASLRTAIALILGTRQPMFIWWGDQLIQFYNDAYREMLGPDLHPWLLGGSGRTDWPSLWPQIGPQIEAVMAGGPASWDRAAMVPVIRFGRTETAFWDCGYSPIHDVDHGGVGGVLVVCNDVTREQQLIRALDRAQQRATFTSALWGALRDDHDPVTIQQIIAQMTGEYFGANRVGFAEKLSDGVTGVIAYEYARDVGPGLKHIRFNEFGSNFLYKLRRGGTVSRSDTGCDLLLSSRERDLHLSLQATGVVDVPILRGGRLAGIFYIHWRERHDSDAEEIALIKNIADQGWSRVEQARLRKALAGGEPLPDAEG